MSTWLLRCLQCFTVVNFKIKYTTHLYVYLKWKCVEIPLLCHDFVSRSWSIWGDASVILFGQRQHVAIYNQLNNFGHTHFSFHINFQETLFTSSSLIVVNSSCCQVSMSCSITNYNFICMIVVIVEVVVYSSTNSCYDNCLYFNV